MTSIQSASRPLKIRKGDIVYVNLDPKIGREINKKRPCVVVQSDLINDYSKTFVVIPITGREHKAATLPPVMLEIPQGVGGLEKNSVVNALQITTIDIKRVIAVFGSLNENYMKRIHEIVKKVLDM